MANQPDPLQGLEVAVDRCEVIAGAEALGQLLGAERLRGLPQRLEQEPAGRRRPQAGRAQGINGRVEVSCVNGGGGGGDGHCRPDSIANDCR